MKKVLLLATYVTVSLPVGLNANAGIVEKGVKGTGKGVKAVAGCVDRGVKGVAKGAKSTVGGVGKAVKSTL